MREIVEECTEPADGPGPQEDAEGCRGSSRKRRDKEKRGERDKEERETEEERRELGARVCSVGPRC